MGKLLVQVQRVKQFDGIRCLLFGMLLIDVFSVDYKRQVIVS